MGDIANIRTYNICRILCDFMTLTVVSKGVKYENRPSEDVGVFGP